MLRLRRYLHSCRQTPSRVIRPHVAQLTQPADVEWFRIIVVVRLDKARRVALDACGRRRELAATECRPYLRVRTPLLRVRRIPPLKAGSNDLRMSASVLPEVRP